MIGIKERQILFDCIKNFIPVRKWRQSVKKYIWGEKNAEKYLKKLQKKVPETFLMPFCDVPEVSIVIPVYNQYIFTKLCLWSIYCNTRKVNYEIIIADDNSFDETKNICEQIKNIRVIRNEKNFGFLKNCNNAVKYARGKFVVLLNNDTVPQKNWLTSLLKVFNEHKRVGVVGAKFIFGTGKLQEAGSMVLKDGTPVNLGWNQYPFLSEFNELKRVDYCSGCGILFEKKLWNKLGGFDEMYSPAYYEDTDFCFRVRECEGLDVYYQPLSEIIHFHNVSYSDKAKEQCEVNKNKFIQKWNNVLEKKGQ